jgi:SAM-dependent methyltransferase
MTPDYDDTIKAHYEKVAHDQGLSSASTMADDITRESETAAIAGFVERSLEGLRSRGELRAATIVDVGCGNGYTLSVLADRWPAHRYVGIEYTDGLRRHAEKRFEGHRNVTIAPGDIRTAGFARGVVADILICQRVLINLLDPADQKNALAHLIDTVKRPEGNGPGGTLAFIEAFSSALARLNSARAEFDLPAIPPAHHNRYLEDDFFHVDGLKAIPGEGALAPNMLSTHYFVARVLHARLTRDRPFQRNSEFVRYFHQALRPDAGDYSPLKFFMFERVVS